MSGDRMDTCTDSIHFRRCSGGIIYLYNQDKMCTPYQDLAFVLDTEAGCMMKYGEASKVKDWLQDINKKLISAGHHEMSTHLVLIKNQNWNIDDVNKFINCTGALAKWYSERNSS
jgi:hypothetical protein